MKRRIAIVAVYALAFAFCLAFSVFCDWIHVEFWKWMGWIK
jgi:hypothetical protein